MRWFAAMVLMAAGQVHGPSLRGLVKDADGHTVQDATVFVTNPASDFSLSTRTSGKGTYSFASLQAGIVYEVHAEARGFASPVAVVRAAPGEEGVTRDLAVGPRIRFDDITNRTGIDFTLRNGATGHFYQPEIMLGGVAALDYNNDGCMDIFVTNGATLPDQVKAGNEYQNRLYRNNCDLTFTDVTAKAGLGGKGYSMGVAAGDFDNDGFVDLLVTVLSANTLYRNRGDGTFEDVTEQSGLGSTTPMWSVSAGWFDYDRDGRLDLFVTHYVEWAAGNDAGCKLGSKPFYCHPRAYRGMPNQLFHNNGNGTFTDVSAQSGLGASIGKGMGVAFGDFNGDGLPDVFVTNDSAPNFLFQNLGDGRFREVAAEQGVAYNGKGNAVAGMGADFRDLNNDGMDDIALDAMYWDGFTLYINQRKTKTFEDSTVSSGLVEATRNLTGWGMGIFDFDNDGRKDLFYTASHFPGSEPQVHSGPALSNHVLRNMGGGRFKDVSYEAGESFRREDLFHGAAFADFDNDGRVDAVVTSVNGPVRIFRNTSPAAGHWLALRLTGTKSNREGLGARVRLKLPNGLWQDNHATTSVGYASSSEPLVRFGLGPYDRAALIEIRWPSGELQMLTDQKADRMLNVSEP